MKIALATCRDLPEPDPDEPLLVRALEDRGATVRMLPWDAEEAEAGELVVLRSTWNYHHDVDAFLAWTARTAGTTKLANPAPVVSGNVRKTYLRDLEARGVAVVPTAFVGREGADITALARARGWSSIVIKPTVSAGSFATARFDLPREASAAQAFLDALLLSRDAMVQAWMPAVDGYGERALVWIDGAFTHAVRKTTRLAGAAEHISAEAPIAEDERAFAATVLANLEASTELLYARVDTIRGEDGRPRLMELELVEPSLFLAQCGPALERLADAIVKRAR